MSESAGHVAVIGSGVVGTAWLYALSQSGWQVTMLDRGEFGRGCSHANCGLVVPSHVLPLAMPGAVKSTLKTLFRKNSPLVVKPGLNFGLYRWLLNFASCCKRDKMLEAGHAISALLNSSMRLYKDMIAKEVLDCEWETQGCLFVFQTQTGMDHYAEVDELQREHFGMGAERWEEERLLANEPALKPGVAGAWYYERDCHLRPDRLLSSWRKVLETRGVTIREQCDVKHFRGTGGTLKAVETTNGEVTADAFVVATGAWTPLLNRELKCHVPIQPGKGYSITMPRPAICPKYPLLLEEHRVAITPMQSGYRLGSMMEFVGYDSSLHPKRVQLLKDGATVYLKEPFCEPVEETWFGWRPMTYDGKPIIDFSPAYQNVLIAAGHNMLGLSMAPATGQLVTELLTGNSPHIDPKPYSLRRFS